MNMDRLAHRVSALKERFVDHELVQKLRPWLPEPPELNFITIHWYYFIFTCLLSSVIFWGSSHPEKSISYTDSLFLVVSAMTEAGLNTVNLSQMTTFQQIILFILIIIGSSIFVSIGTILTRKRAFEKIFGDEVRKQKEARARRRRSVSTQGRPRREDLLSRENLAPEDRVRKESELREQAELDVLSSATEPSKPPMNGSPGKSLEEKDTGSLRSVPHLRGGGGDDTVVNDNPDQISQATVENEPRQILSFVGVGEHPNSTVHRRKADKTPDIVFGEDVERFKHEILDHAQFPPYLTRHTTGRNGQFFGLSEEQRKHLGGVEYRAITLLLRVVVLYFVLWQFLGSIALGAYMANNKAAVSESNGINPWWMGIFNGVSAFNNSGMSLLDANMVPFQTSAFTLITMGLMILAGNTAYPLFLRLIFWSGHEGWKLVYPDPDRHRETKAVLRFILSYPRRVYTNLFPAKATWWLLFMVIILNGIDWAAFELLNIGNQFVTTIPKHYRVLDGLFQALAVRSGGFYVIGITQLRIGLQVLYVIMMYISVYPVVITMRHSNVYEERSLGIYADDKDENDDDEPPKLGTLGRTFKRTMTLAVGGGPFSRPESEPSGMKFLRQQVRGQLAHDLWGLVLAIFLITCIEGSNFDRDPTTYSVFNIIFEVVSAYGCVGISTGVPNNAYSFSGSWKTTSKLILCVVMLRGRHRGLPVALDKAIRLPGSVADQDEHRELRRSMSLRRLSLSEPV